jgi:membrane-associated protease RseP (regulator of RpoE activity)
MLLLMLALATVPAALALAAVATPFDGEPVAAATADEDQGGDQAAAQDEDRVIERKVVFVSPGGGDRQHRVVDVLRCKDGECQRATENLPEGAPVISGGSAVWVDDQGETHELHSPGPHSFFVEAGPRGFLGVMLDDLTSELRQHFGAPEDAGVLVARVEADSPAAVAGVKVGDVITSLDGEWVRSSHDVRRRVRGMDEGQTVRMDLVRGGRPMTLDVVAARREVPEVDARQFLWRVDEGEGGEQAFQYQIDTEAMGEAVREMSERFSRPEVQDRLLKLHRFEGDLEQRIEELETKIQQLERQLQDKGDGGE